jgi:hypothetical protein
MKAIYREIQRNFKPKIGKVSLRISFFEQSRSFATNHVVSAMNSQRYHVLRKPTLQDLRRLKFTRQIVQSQGFFTGGNRAVYRGYRCYRWGTVTVPSGSNRSQNSNLNLN